MITEINYNVTALVVDDSPLSLWILERMLAGMSIETHSASNVAEAKALLATFTPTVAIIDVQLPDGEGTDILLAIRKANLPTAITFITASLEMFPFHKCNGSPPDMLVSKPVVETALSDWIGKMVAKQGIAWGGHAKKAG